MRDPVNCEHFEGFAVLFALGELEPSARESVERHALVCAECAAILRREMALAALLSSERRSAPAEEPSELLLARCRNELGKSLDNEAAAQRRRAWIDIFSPREWIEVFRFSPRFHPAWSAAALVLLGIISGLAGWQGIGRATLQQWGPTAMTVFAAPPPSVTAAPTMLPPAEVAPTPQRPAPNRSTVDQSAEDSRVYSASDAGTGNSQSNWFDAAAAEQLQAEAASGLRRNEPTPRAWRHEPPMRMPAAGSLNADVSAFDDPSGYSLAEISRRMETLWWGGVRVNPSDQQRRLVQAQAPEYPEVARRAGIEGQVTLLLHIDTNGAVRDAQLISGEPVLGRAAAEAVEQWRYRPVRVHGEPVNVLTSVTLAFELR